MEVPRHKVLHFPETSGFRPFSKYFVQDAVAHPAKANCYMLYFLIKTFTREGDTILDPMAGTGSTGVIANLLGRNAILVDLEEKFCNWMRKNIKLVEKDAKGKSVVIQGDSRKLSQLLKENADTIVTSPPYSLSLSTVKTGRGKTGRGEQRIQGERGLMKPYSLSRNNIGNLPHGEIDAVITSPPYSESITKFEDEKGTKKRLERMKEAGYSRKTTGIYRQADRSPTGAYQGFREGYSEDKRNIGNLPHGEIDVVITSPPFSEQNISPPSKQVTEWWKKHRPRSCEVSSVCGRMTYSDNPNNIGNLPHGEIDVVITSPPFGESLQYRGGTQNKEQMMKGGRPAPYSKFKGNIGNLSFGSVDAIITSPPYSEGIGHALGENIGKRVPEEVRKSQPFKVKVKLGRSHELIKLGSEGQIGALPHGEIDTIITSPPYGHDSVVHKDRSGETLVAKEKFGYSDFYSSSKDNIGNLKRETYLEAMLKVYRECWKVLRRGGLMIIIVKNFIRNKKVVRLDLDTIKLCQVAGFKLIDRYYRKLKQRSFWRILYQKKYPNVPTIDYEHILVFQKVS